MYCFAKVFVIFIYFHLKIFAKTKINFRENFRENAKTKILVSTLGPSMAENATLPY
jgi:hypothetical protein